MPSCCSFKPSLDTELRQTRETELYLGAAVSFFPVPLGKPLWNELKQVNGVQMLLPFSLLCLNTIVSVRDFTVHQIRTRKTDVKGTAAKWQKNQDLIARSKLLRYSIKNLQNFFHFTLGIGDSLFCQGGGTM